MEHSQRITVEWDGEWWIVSDEGGEFARAGGVDQAIRYVEDLMHGPPTYAVLPAFDGLGYSTADGRALVAEVGRTDGPGWPPAN